MTEKMVYDLMGILVMTEKMVYDLMGILVMTGKKVYDLMGVLVMTGKMVYDLMGFMRFVRFGVLNIMDLLQSSLVMNGNGYDKNHTHIIPSSQPHILAVGCLIWVFQKILTMFHCDVIKWKQFLQYCSLVRGIHQSVVDSSHKGQWCRVPLNKQFSK